MKRTRSGGEKKRVARHSGVNLGVREQDGETQRIRMIIRMLWSFCCKRNKVSALRNPHQCARTGLCLCVCVRLSR